MNPKLEETIVLDFITSSSTGAAADADSLPTCEVFEDANDTAILSPTVTKRTSKTGDYRVSIACTAANGFEAAKSYNVVVSATIGGVASKAVLGSFQMRTRSVDDVSTYAGGAVASVTGDVGGKVLGGGTSDLIGVGVLSQPHVFVVCSGDEIRVTWQTGLDCYAIIRTGDQYAAGTTLETFDATHWSSYVLELPEIGTSGVYAAAFPSLPAGVYAVEVYQVKAGRGGMPVITDAPPIGGDPMEWSGTAQIPLSSIGSGGGGSDKYMQARIYGAAGPVDIYGRQTFYAPPNADDAGTAKVRFSPTNPRGGREVELDP